MPELGQWEGQDVPLVRRSSCIVKGGISSFRRYLPTYLRCERGPQTYIDPKICKLHGFPPQKDAKYYRGQCSSLEEPHTQSNSSVECVHAEREWFNPDEYDDLACYLGYEPLVHCSVQCPDGTNRHGSTIRGREGRRPARTKRHGSTIRGEESRTPPTTNNGSANPSCSTPLERKLPLE